MQVHRWNQVEKEQITPKLGRQMIHGETMTIARLEMKQGSFVPEHSHHNEQITTIEKGRLKFVFGGKEVVIGAGESLQIPPHLPHSAEALEDSVAVDVFSPPREDWIRGDDAYLRK
ncbi:MAG TPA: cupin domain-containing protein [Bryobacteraceae bacterium]|jgi:quercetin dioxygenase-like cupin family protein|nr:cupin domain-containing protein [Bryobacteraceae bacterium]